MTPEASVVIVTWNGRQYLDACLRAVAAQQGVVTETILVDNASTDGTIDFVRDTFPWVRIVALSENRGFAGGNNAGVREAIGRVVALLNNDTVADPGWLRALLGGLDEAGGFALTTSRVVYMHDPEIVDSAGDGMLRAGGAFKRNHGGPVSAVTVSQEVFGVCGAACAMPKAVWDELGGFDERFFFSHEDVDLSYRARLLGYRCRYMADAVVHHHGSVTIGRTSARSVFQGQRNLEWVYVKNTPAGLLWTTLPEHLLYTLAAAVHFGRSGRLLPFLRGKLAALAALPAVLGDRARVQRGRRVDAGAIARLLEPDWLGVKRREKRFDGGIQGRPSPPEAPHTHHGAESEELKAPSRRVRLQPDVHMAPEITAVIVNFNAGAELAACLESIAAAMHERAWEAVVVDNASSDGSEAVTARFEPQARLLRNPANIGFGRAVNQGLALARAPLLLVINPDCRLAIGALEPLEAALEAHPSCAIVGPKILDPDGAVQGSARGDPDMLTGLFGRTSALRRLLPGLRVSTRNVVHVKHEPGTVDAIRVDWVSGACMLARSGLLRSVGGFDERYFLYWEDADLCRRLRHRGHETRYVPDAVAIHRVGQSSRNAQGLSIRAFHDSAYLYYATHVAPGLLSPTRLLARALLVARRWWLLRGAR